MISIVESSKEIYNKVCYNLLEHSINYLSEVRIIPQTLFLVNDRYSEANTVYINDDIVTQEEISKEKLLNLLKKLRESKLKTKSNIKSKLVSPNTIFLKNSLHNTAKLNSVNYDKFKEINDLYFVELLVQFKMIGLYYLINPTYKCVDSLDRLFSEGQVKDIRDYLELICKYLKSNSKKTNEKILYNNFNNAFDENKIVKIKLI